MGLLSDIRISIRTLTKNRAFTIAAVLTVAIGIGATTAIATIVESILLRPLPYPDSERIVQVISYRREGAATVRAPSMARPFILGLSERSRSFSSVGTVDSFSNVTRRRLTMTVAGQFGAAELTGTPEICGARKPGPSAYTDAERSNAAAAASTRRWRGPTPSGSCRRMRTRQSCRRA